MRRSLPVLVLVAGAFLGVQAETVLVLPFANQSSTHSLDWIGESVAHTVGESLAARGLLVLGREDRQEAYRRLSIRSNAPLTHATAIKVAEELDAGAVIFGQFDLTPPAPGGPAGTRGSLHVTAWTVNMGRMRSAPEIIGSGPLDDLAALQKHLAWQLLRQLDPEGTPEAELGLNDRASTRLDAMENYTRGLLASNDEQKHRYLTQAARLDDRFWEPAFELGKLHFGHKEYQFAAGWFAKVKPPATRLLEATFLLGLCRYYTGDYAAAEQAFTTVAESVPLNEVYNNLGAAQSRRNLPSAAESFRKAVEGDPADPDYHFNVGFALWKRGDFEAAANGFRAVLDRNPEDAQATLLLGRCIQKSGPRPADLKAGFERVKLNYEEGAWRQLKAALEAGKSKPRKSE